uniref:Uncharacterized protein n=1 Tax=Oryza sativa subsp. japonica TaxID=39947 RepID=Q6K4Z0_ORYSJ|nr:hypothetical protein [Oryza sativa Japonica Group]BAD19814.1 hypothetical protein [Oryza sativa Japonica Group]
MFRSLDNKADRVGGVGGAKDVTEPPPPPVITSPWNYCFWCPEEIKHPEDEASYQAGHKYT